jgi:hypothetical protein
MHFQRTRAFVSGLLWWCISVTCHFHLPHAAVYMDLHQFSSVRSVPTFTVAYHYHHRIINIIWPVIRCIRIWTCMTVSPPTWKSSAARSWCELDAAGAAAAGVVGDDGLTPTDRMGWSLCVKGTGSGPFSFLRLGADPQSTVLTWHFDYSVW